MSLSKDDKLKLELEAEEIEKKIKVSKKASYIKNKSKLDKYRGEILYLNQVKEKSPTFIKKWLRTNKRMIVHRTTISRRIDQWINGER